MAAVAVSRASRRGLGVVVPLLVGACAELRSADQMSVRIDSDRITWESGDGELWGIVDLLERGGVIWALTSAPPFVHGLQRGEEVVTFGLLGEGPDELRSARALLDRGDAGEITMWDPANQVVPHVHDHRVARLNPRRGQHERGLGEYRPRDLRGRPADCDHAERHCTGRVSRGGVVGW